MHALGFSIVRSFIMQFNIVFFIFLIIYVIQSVVFPRMCTKSAVNISILQVKLYYE